MTVREMTTIIGLSRRGVEEQIKALKTKGVLSRIGSTKVGYWEINEYLCCTSQKTPK